jgi:hypothetical protein
MFLLASLKAHLILKIVPAHQNSVPIFLRSHWSIFSRPSRLSEKFLGSWGQTAIRKPELQEGFSNLESDFEKASRNFTLDFLKQKDS